MPRLRAARSMSSSTVMVLLRSRSARVVSTSSDKWSLRCRWLMPYRRQGGKGAGNA